MHEKHSLYCSEEGITPSYEQEIDSNYLLKPISPEKYEYQKLILLLFQQTYGGLLLVSDEDGFIIFEGPIINHTNEQQETTKNTEPLVIYDRQKEEVAV